MGILIFCALLLLLGAIMIISVLKVVGCIMDLVVGLCRLIWAVASAFDKLVVRTCHEAQEEADQQIAPQPGLRLVARRD